MSEVHDQTPPKSSHILFAVAVTTVLLIIIFIGLVFIYKGTVTAERVRKERGVTHTLEKTRAYEKEALKNIDEMKKKVIEQYNQ